MARRGGAWGEQSTWDQAKIELLIKLEAEGLKYEDIGKRLGGLSRVAVSAKLRRLGYCRTGTGRPDGKRDDGTPEQPEPQARRVAPGESTLPPLPSEGGRTYLEDIDG